MKTPKEIELLESLPQRESISRVTHGGWGRRSRWRWLYNKYPLHKIIRRILKEFTNKPVNDAFSKYCTLVPKYAYDDFWEEFRDRYGRPGHDYSTKYLIEDGIIKLNENWRHWRGRNKTPYIFYSSDYRVELRHRHTGKPPTEDHLKWMSLYKDSYNEVIVSGEIITFDSKKEKGFKRYHWERVTRLRKLEKFEDQKRKTKQYSFLTREETLRKEQMANDLISRDRHGFNNLSFKGEHYHGRKKKKLKLKELTLA